MTRPSITLDYENAVAEELATNPLYQKVLSECKQECEFYLTSGGPKGAIAMDIVDIVDKYSEEHPQINVPLWAGIICVSLFPSLFADNAGAA